ncbi:hypothetical protein PJP13_24285 [Mycobacterium kansasii]
MPEPYYTDEQARGERARRYVAFLCVDCGKERYSAGPRKQAAAKREATERSMDWDAAILRLKAMLNRIESESPQEAS